MGAVREWKKEIASFTAMAAVELAEVGINTMYKAATLTGLSYFVFIAYSYIIGTLSLLPLPFIFPRREAVPPLQLSVLYRIIMSATLGIVVNVCGYKGVEYSSPALSSAINNLTPAFTFVLAAIFGLENMELRSSTTQTKIIGTMLSISGALVAVLYKGPAVLSPASSSLLSVDRLQTNWILGGSLLVLSSLLGSIWYNLQGKVMKMYPDEKTVTLIYFMCKTVIAVPICVVAEANSSDWKLRPDLAMVTIVLAGLFGPAFNTFLNTWIIHLKGPLYASIFTPFSVAIAAAVGVIFLGDTLFLGSIVGATILLLGFYAVLWATAQEGRETKDCASASPHEKTPLLPS